MNQQTVNSTEPSATTIATLGLVGAVTYLLYLVDRENGTMLTGAVLVAAICWLIANQGLSCRNALTIGILMRVGALFSFPLLSDDIYRFLWDGELWLAGFHPLDFVPAEAPSAFAKTHAALLSKMNSAAYYTVYPPLSQLVFTFAAWLGQSIASATFWLKVPLFLAELGVLRLLFLLEGEGKHRGVTAYALLPLPIIETIGNAHFEGLAILGVLFALFSFRQNTLKPNSWSKVFLGGAGLAFGVLAKLVPLLTAPAFTLMLLWKKEARTNWDWKSAIGFGVSTILLVGIGMGVFLGFADLSGFGESLNLYFQKFEFNGSVYVLASALGQWYKGWNWIEVIGPSLSILSMLSIIALATVRAWRKQGLATTLLFSFGAYLLCATTVHPWYAIYIVALAPLTKYKWPYVLAFTVFLSYLAYGTTDIVVPVWATILEYGLVFGMLLFELRKESYE